MPQVKRSSYSTAPAPTYDRRPRRSRNAKSRHRQVPAKRHMNRRPVATHRNRPVSKPITERKPSILKEVVRYVGLAAMYGAAGAVAGAVVGTVATGSGLGMGTGIGAGVGAVCGIAYGLFRAYTGRSLRRGAEGAIKVLPMATSLPMGGNPMIGQMLTSNSGQAILSDALVEGADFIDHDADIRRMSRRKDRFARSRKVAANKLSDVTNHYLGGYEEEEAPRKPRRSKAPKRAKRRHDHRVYA